jgi:hypothetical protein
VEPRLELARRAAVDDEGQHRAQGGGGGEGEEGGGGRGGVEGALKGKGFRADGGFLVGCGLVRVPPRSPPGPAHSTHLCLHNAVHRGDADGEAGGEGTRVGMGGRPACGGHETVSLPSLPLCPALPTHTAAAADTTRPRTAAARDGASGWRPSRGCIVGTAEVGSWRLCGRGGAWCVRASWGAAGGRRGRWGE